MLRSRIHRIFSDYSTWMIYVILTLILCHFLNHELRSENLLYTYRELLKRCNQEGGLAYLNWIFNVNYATPEEFLTYFAPHHLETLPNRLAAAICTNSSAMVFTPLFPTFMLAKRLAGPEPTLAISHGNSRTRYFVHSLVGTLICTILMLDISAACVLIYKGVAISQIDAFLLLNVFILRLPMILSWYMPFVFISYLTQSMFLSSLSSLFIFCGQLILSLRFPSSFLFSYYKWTQNDMYTVFWSTPQPITAIISMIFPSLCIILLWSILSYVIYSARRLRSDVI